MPTYTLTISISSRICIRIRHVPFIFIFNITNMNSDERGELYQLLLFERHKTLLVLDGISVISKKFFITLFITFHNFSVQESFFFHCKAQQSSPTYFCKGTSTHRNKIVLVCSLFLIRKFTEWHFFATHPPNSVISGPYDMDRRNVMLSSRFNGLY